MTVTLHLPGTVHDSPADPVHSDRELIYLNTVFEGTTISLKPSCFCVYHNEPWICRTLQTARQSQGQRGLNYTLCICYINLFSTANPHVLFRTVAMMVPDYAMIGEIMPYFLFLRSIMDVNFSQVSAMR